ncbi:MAG: flavodoxin domain-containing protein [Halanaerobium sp.]
MKTAVVYWSKTGFVKKYAEWIAEEIKADLIEGNSISIEAIKNYKSLVFGGSLYAGGINGADFMKKVLHNPEFKNKKIAVFAAGASSSTSEVINEVKNNNFDDQEQQRFKFYYLRGGFDYNKLGFKDKILMNMMKWKLKRKKKSGEKLNGDEMGMLSAFNEAVDFTDKSSIKSLVEYIKN